MYGLGSAPDFENPAEALRRARVISLLESRGHSVDDLGDPSGFQFREIRDPETGIKDLDLWIELSRCLPIKLETMLGRKVFPLLLGGDCSMPAGILSAFARRDTEVGLVFLDGHADFHTPESSAGGDPADMELAVLTGRGSRKIARVAGKFPLLAEEDAVVSGRGIRSRKRISGFTTEGEWRRWESGRPWKRGWRASPGEIFPCGFISTSTRSTRNSCR